MWQVKLGVVSSVLFGVSDAMPFGPAWLQGGALSVLGAMVFLLFRQNSELLKKHVEACEKFAESHNEVGKALNNLSTTCAVAQAKNNKNI